MPIFDYVCSHCESHFEKLVPRADSEVCCTRCGSERVAKQFSVFATVASGKSAEAAPPCGPDGAGCPCGGPQAGMCQMA